MIQTINCTNCGRSTKPIDEQSAWAVIKLTNLEYCNSCKHGHNDGRDIRFCSTRCLVLFVQRCGDRILKLEQDLVTHAEDNSWVTEDQPGVGRVSVNKYVNPLYDPVQIETTNPLDDLTEEEKRTLKENPEKYIHVIKSVRERTSLGLKQSKDLVDRYRR